MKEVNFKLLCNALKRVVPKAPVTYINETSIIFRGQTLAINGFNVNSRLFEFRFNNAPSFIDNLREYGLMVNYRELDGILKIYELELEKEFNYENN